MNAAIIGRRPGRRRGIMYDAQSIDTLEISRRACEMMAAGASQADCLIFWLGQAKRIVFMRTPVDICRGQRNVQHAHQLYHLSKCAPWRSLSAPGQPDRGHADYYATFRCRRDAFLSSLDALMPLE